MRDYCTESKFGELIVPQDLAIEMAKNCKANYVLAQDPDSDRFSACELQCAILYPLLIVFLTHTFKLYRCDHIHR